MVVMAAPQRGRVADVAQRRGVARGQKLMVGFRQLDQSRPAAGGDRQHMHVAGALGTRLGRRRRFLQDGVGIGAAIAERVDRDAGRIRAGRHRLRATRQPQAQFGKSYFRIGGLKIGDRRDAVVLEAQARLDDARDARRRFEMADIRLDGADDARVVRRAIPADSGAKRGGLDRIAERRACAVRLDVADLARAYLAVRAHLPHQRLLRVRVRRGDAVGAPILIHPGGAHQGVDLVAVLQRRQERLQDHDAGALAAPIAVRPRIEALAAAVGRQESAFAPCDRTFRTQHHVDAASERERALAVPKRLAGLMERDQRGRAGRVHRDAGTAEIEHVGQAVGEVVHGRAQLRMGADGIPVQRAELREQIVEHEGADIDAGF